MFQYDTAYEPPAPIARVYFDNVDDAADPERIEALMLIDTGADISLIPRHVVEAIRAQPTGRVMQVVAFDGRQSECAVVAATMHLDKYKLTVEFLLHEQGETTGIIGRNILNLLYVVLDGPATRWNLGLTRP